MTTVHTMVPEDRLRLTATAALIERFNDLSRLPRPAFEARFSNPRAAVEYFRQSCEACQELLTLHQVTMSEVDKMRAEVDRLRDAVENRPADAHGGGDLVALQRAVVERLGDSVREVPDGTYLAVSYEGKILGRASTVAELSALLAGLRISPRQAFIHLKGSSATFRSV